MSEIAVSFSGLDQVAQHLGAARSAMERQLEDLKASLQPLVATWSGEAAQNYQVQQAKIDQSLTDMGALLAQTQGRVNTSNANFSATERKIANSFQV